MSASEIVLEAKQLSRKFMDFVAVDNVNLKVRRGHIHALIGPNGAGKTTCFNLLTRFLPPSAGQIFYNGNDVTKQSPARLSRQGMVRSFQISATFGSLTVMQNVVVGLQRLGGGTFAFWQPASRLDHHRARAEQLLQEVGLLKFADQVAGSLPYGRRRALEIATTLAMEPELLLLDEPTQGMGHEDVAEITDLIKTVAQGRTVLLVEHNMKVVSRICDRISVLQRGAIIAEGTFAEVSADQRVAEAYIGSTVPERVLPEH
ncbi:ABC transporter ATP-binding protein [Tardiphaga sp.]|jgi:branched-chain amino acid transport system ATP-binding protein|uniref:ABC transporter ATP-binding protein n=1 Tax=Tardiphaga sp. TaxID=1926292 RepID=UPI0037D9BDCD